MIRCDRCGERKDDKRFRPDQPYWNRWCIRCERSPVGDFPLPETKEDVWQDSDEAYPNRNEQPDIHPHQTLQKQTQASTYRIRRNNL